MVNVARTFLCVGLVLSGVMVTFGALADSLRVNPVRIFLSAQTPIAVLKVHNGGTVATVMQLEGVSWQQSAGEDIFVPTREILATPPIFTVPPGGTQIVRVGLWRQTDSRRELTYRLFLQEVPTGAAKEDKIRILWRFGIPVFVAPDGTTPKPLLEWRAVETSQKTLRIEAINQGDAHVLISSFSLAATDGSLLAEQQGMNYLLPEQGHHWLITIDKARMPGTRLRIIAQTDGGVIDAEVSLEQ